MKLLLHAPTGLLITTAALVFQQMQPSHPVCQAQKYSFFSTATAAKRLSPDESTVESGDDDRVDDDSDSDRPPFYGSPLKPIDVHYNVDAMKNALSVMRNEKRLVVRHSDAANLLATCANDQHVTLTLIGYKGGDLQAQINQDRAVIVAPYSIRRQSKQRHRSRNQPPAVIKDGAQDVDLERERPLTIYTPAVESFLNQERLILGVFDGHAPFGELVSEYTATQLPRLLAKTLVRKAVEAGNKHANSKQISDRDVLDLTKAALVETFVELNRSAPASPSGGCTASVILMQDSRIYVANAGDSRSFIVAYRPSTNNVTVTYISREDKPSLPDERARIEAYGGQVYIPARGTSRVVYHDSTTGAPTGLAMSRSIGDWEAGNMGVIPNPIVDVIDVPLLVAQILMEDSGDETDPDSYQVDPVGRIIDASDYSSNNNDHLVGGAKDDVHLFAVSATDGMMDYLMDTQIARILAHSLFDDAGAHPIAASEHLIFAAANAWQEAKQGRYRDDIAIAVSALRRPPKYDPSSES